MKPILETERLILRRWQESDIEPFFALCQDPVVMEFFPRMPTREEVETMVGHFNAGIDQHGYAWYACELKATGEFIGFVGLSRPQFEAHFTPCVEVGWRLAAPYWGKGYATEAAKAVLDDGFQKYGLREIVSFTVPANLRSRRVMEKLGMQRDAADDFKHPKLPPEHLFSQHVLYRIRPHKAVVL